VAITSDLPARRSADPVHRTAVSRIASSLAVLARAGHHLRDHHLREVGPADDDTGGLRWSLYAPLSALTDGGPQRVTDLADTLHMSPSSISRTVAHLVQDGLVLRTADDADGRACRLVVTARGHAEYERLVRRRDDVITAAVGGWSDDDRDRLADLLPRLVTDLGLADAPTEPNPRRA
jgi:DNA-binding MarR family transcriptional regulator